MKTFSGSKKAHESSQTSATENKNTEEITLEPRTTGDGDGFSAFSDYQVGVLVSLVISWLSKLYSAADAAFPKAYRKYWQRFTRAFLGAENNDLVWVSAARAGSGKTMWMTAFILALCELEIKGDKLYEAVKGGLVFVVQKVETLNELSDTIEQWFPGKRSLIGVVQSLTPSGKQRGMCRNPDVESFHDCTPSECTYADGCSIAHSAAKGRTSLVTGITQARFLRYRKSEDAMHSLVYRSIDGEEIPRRFLLFDERFEMAEIATLSKERLNHLSSSIEKLGNTHGVPDSTVAFLQSGMTFSAAKWFDKLRWEQRIEDANGKKRDLPFGFCSLEDKQEAAEHFSGFYKHLNSPWLHVALSTEDEECLKIMAELLKGSCPFVKSGGFRILHITPPNLVFSCAQTLIFDATAPVDGDYMHLENAKLYERNVERNFSNLVFHMYGSPGCNVSKAALSSPEKDAGMQRLVQEIVDNAEGRVYLATYKKLSAGLFGDEIPDQVCQIDGKLPYYGGTNGSNDFRDCRTVILLGWPRLTPDTFFIYCLAAWGKAGFYTEIEDTVEAFRHDGIPQNPMRQLPMLKDYEARYLTARVEQEIYRSNIRITNCTNQVHVHLFYPPEGVWPLLKQRFPGCQEDIITDLPDSIKEAKGRGRKYKGDSTAYSKLAAYLESWQGPEILVAELRDQVLGISKSVWGDLIKDQRVKELLHRLNIARESRGKHTKLV